MTVFEISWLNAARERGPEGACLSAILGNGEQYLTIKVDVVPVHN